MSRDKDFIDYIERDGWMIVCESPLNIEHEDGADASGIAAEMVLDELDDEWCAIKNEKLRASQPPVKEYPMKKYGEKEIDQIEWTRYKIVVPTKADKDELLSASEHIHNSDVDTDYVTVNQIAHEYYDKTGNNIIVDKKLYNKLNDGQTKN